MLGYEWGNHSPPQPPPPPQLIITDDHDLHLHHHHHDPSSHHHHRPIFDDPYSTPCTFPHTNTPLPPSSLFNLHSNTPPPHFPLYDTDPRAFPCASSSPSYPSLFQVPLPLASESTLQSPGYPVLVPKPEPDFQNRIGLNLGGRTYFASDDDLVSRLYRRSRGGDQPVNTPKCQAEGCHADLSHAKHYHRRHKVCEFHSKAATVVAAGLTQRFCQQCSRFHVLSEFDNGKRSCRKRLADHNRRRRKSHHQQQQQQQQQAANRDQREPLSHSYPDIPPKSPSQSIQRSTSDSGANSSSSVTVAISSPLASFDSNFRQRSYE